MNFCRQMYYSTCRDLKVKANKIWAIKTSMSRYYLVESPLYGIVEEVVAHCAWCAKTQVIGRVEKFEEKVK